MKIILLALVSLTLLTSCPAVVSPDAQSENSSRNQQQPSNNFLQSEQYNNRVPSNNPSRNQQQPSNNFLQSGQYNNQVPSNNFSQNQQQPPQPSENSSRYQPQQPPSNVAQPRQNEGKTSNNDVAKKKRQAVKKEVYYCLYAITSKPQEPHNFQYKKLEEGGEYITWTTSTLLTFYEAAKRAEKACLSAHKYCYFVSCKTKPTDETIFLNNLPKIKSL